MPKYDFISDPGHGWLKVPRSEVNSLGIGPKVSSCSYEQGDYVYLEEDCDAGRYISHCNPCGLPADTEFDHVDHKTDYNTGVRSFDRYDESVAATRYYEMQKEVCR